MLLTVLEDSRPLRSLHEAPRFAAQPTQLCAGYHATSVMPREARRLLAWTLQWPAAVLSHKS